MVKASGFDPDIREFDSLTLSQFNVRDRYGTGSDSKSNPAPSQFDSDLFRQFNLCVAQLGQSPRLGSELSLVQIQPHRPVLYDRG